jgi:peptidoglycan/LPS O-acetylase OafA/YrhL
MRKMKVVTRFGSLDMLRGVAALLVVWQHSSETLVKLPTIQKNGTFLADIASTLDFGRIGVICFFLISGFVVPYSLGMKAKLGTKRKFIIRRFFRLFPAYWFSILVALVVGYLFQINYGFNNVLSNLTMLQSFLGQAHMQGIYWTLQVELVFYILCIVLYNLGVLQNTKTIFCIIIFLFFLFTFSQIATRFIFDIPITSGASILKEFMLMPYLIAIMFLGTLMRQAYDSKTPNKEQILFTLIATVICFGLPFFLLLTSLIGLDLIQDSMRFGASHCLALTLFLLGLFFNKEVPKAFTWLGVISYSIYLFHPFIISGLMVVLKSNQIAFMHNLHLSLYMSIIFILTILVSSYIYLYVEMPAMKLGKNISEQKELILT